MKMASIEKMKNTLIDYEVDYIRSIILKGNFSDLIEYVVTNKFSEFKDITEVINMANNTNYGLAGYIFTKDINTAWQVSEELQFGMVGINSGILSTEVAPFGGVKESGIGREGAIEGIDEYMEIKYLCFGNIL